MLGRCEMSCALTLCYVRQKRGEGMNIFTAKTKLAGILGHPVSHSLSPKLHSFLAEKTGTDLAYLAFDIEKKEQLSGVFTAAGAMGILGFNVTAPYKVDAFSLADILDEDARALGNVNTMVNDGGKWVGYNTDGVGFMRSLARQGVSAEGKHILLVGTGGTARTLSYKFAQAGAASVSIVSRKENPLAEISGRLSCFSETELRCGADKNFQYDIAVNCTPLGMGEYKDKNPMPKELLYHSRLLCCDLIYNPAKTVFLQEAEKAGVKTMNGLGMLLYQGVCAFELFTGRAVSDAVCEELFRYFDSDNK